MSWKKIGGLNYNESKRTVSDYEGNLYNKLIVNDLSVNNNISVDESVGINLPATELDLSIPKHKQLLLSVGGNYKQTGSVLEIFNQDSTNNNNKDQRQALVHSDDDILKINPNLDYEKSVEIYSSDNYPTQIIGDLNVINTSQTNFKGSNTTNKSLEFYTNFNSTNFDISYINVSNLNTELSLDGKLNIHSVVNIQDKDISANSLADLYIASAESNNGNTKDEIITEISSNKTALTHNTLDRLVLNENKDYTGGVHIRGGKYNHNIFLDGNVQIGYCQKTDVDVLTFDDGSGNVVVQKSYGAITDNDAYNKAYTSGPMDGVNWEFDASKNSFVGGYMLDIAGSCRIRGDLLYVDGDFIVEGSKVILNQEEQWSQIDNVRIDDTLLLGWGTLASPESSLMSHIDLLGNTVNRNSTFLGNPYTFYSEFNDYDSSDQNLGRNYGGLYFANTRNNTASILSTPATGNISPANLTTDKFQYTGIVKRALNYQAGFGSELLLYNYKYPQNYLVTTSASDNVPSTTFNHNGDRIRLFGSNIRFDTYNEIIEPGDTTNNHFNDVKHTRMIIDSKGNVGIGDKFKSLTTVPNVKLEIDGTDALKIPVGTNDSDRPTVPEVGQIRYNSLRSTYEGYTTANGNSAWSSLGGVRDSDGDTYISTENYPGSNDNTLRFFANSIEAITIDNSGNVTVDKKLNINDSIGVQNNDPQYPLDVTGDIHTTSDLRLGQEGKADNSLQSYGTLNLKSETGEIQFYTNNAHKMTLNTNGNLGIAESNPETLLHISNSDSGTGNKGFVKLQDYSHLYFKNPATASDIWGIAPRNSGKLSLLYSNSLADQSDSYVTGGDLMTFLPNGNIGINETSPETKFHFGANQNGFIKFQDNAHIYMINGDTFNSTPSYWGLATRSTGIFSITHSTSLENNSNSTISGDNDIFTVSPSKKVGILNNTPQYDLDVTGDINFTGDLRVDGTKIYYSTSENQWLTTNANIHYTDGFVGVGVTTPQVPLHILYNNNTNASSQYEKVGLVIENAYQTDGVNTFDADAQMILHSKSVGEDHIYFYHDNTNYWDITSQAVDGNGTEVNKFKIRSHFTGSTIEKIVIDENKLSLSGVVDIDQQLGIGTSSPDSSTVLDVVGRVDMVNTTAGNNKTHFGYGNTGDIYLRSANSTGNVIIQDSGGSVGVGTANPGYKLDVTGDINFSGNLRVNGQIVSISTSTNQWLHSSSTNNIYYTAGNVGIGTSSPTSLLQVAGVVTANEVDISNTGKLSFGDVTGNNTSDPGIYWHSSLNYGIYRTEGDWIGPDYQQLMVKFNSGIILHPGNGIYGKSHVGVVGGMSIGDSYYSTNYNNGLIVQGNVGVGISNPEYKLDVNGDIRIPQNYNPDGASDKLLFYSSTGFGEAGINYVGGELNNMQNSSYLNLFTNNSSKMVVRSDGNVGIGTTSPSENLHVMNNIALEGNIIINDNDDSNYAVGHKIQMRTGNDNDGGIYLFRGNPGEYDNKFNFIHKTDTQGNYRAAIEYNDSEKITFTNNGFVGINTNRPLANVHVDQGPILVTNVEYSINQNQPYLIAGTSGFTDETTNWNTYGFQHRFKSNSSNTSYVTIDGTSGEVFACQSDKVMLGLGNGGNIKNSVQIIGDSGLTISPSTTNAMRTAVLRLGSPFTDNHDAYCSKITSTNDPTNNYNSDIQFYTSSGNKVIGDLVMRLTPQAQVGIGTTAPGAKLEVRGPLDGDISKATTSSYLSSKSALRLTGNSTSDYLNIGLIGSSNGNNPSAFFQMSWDNDGFVSDTLGGGALGTGTNILLNPLGGKIGIGTTTPEYKLHVNGDTCCNGYGYFTGGDFNNLRNIGVYVGTSTSGTNKYASMQFSSTTGDSWIDFVDDVDGSSDYHGRMRYNYNDGFLFYTSSTERMRINSTGHVGIGTQSPLHKLDVDGDINLTGNLRVNGAKISLSTATNQWDGTGNNVYYTTGNVGVGTTNPVSALHIFADRNNTSKLEGIHLGRNGSAGAYDEAIEFVSSGSNCHLDFKKTSGNSDFDGRILYNTSSHYLTFFTNNTERIRLDSNGRLGIGKTNPSHPLDVNGDVNTNHYYEINSVKVLWDANNNAGNFDPYAQLRVIQNQTSRNDGMYINYDSTGTTSAHLRFFANGKNERMRIMADSGNVGIGTTNPGKLLHVSGSTAIGINTVLDSPEGVSDPSIQCANIVLHNGSSSDQMYIRRQGFADYCIQTGNNSGNFQLQPYGGNVGIGTTSPDALLDVNGSIKAGYNSNTTSYFGRSAIGYVGHNDWSGISHIDSNTTTGYALLQNSSGLTLINCNSSESIEFRANNNTKMKMTSSGELQATSFVATSDIRHKENISELNDPLGKICSIRGVNFNFKEDNEKNTHAGILAQEVESVIPEAINKSNKEKWSANYNTFVSYLIESVKILKKDCDDKDKKIENLESKLQEQEQLIQKILTKVNLN